MLRRWKQGVFIVACAALLATVFGGAAGSQARRRTAVSRARRASISGSWASGSGDEIANVRADVASEALARPMPTSRTRAAGSTTRSSSPRWLRATCRTSSTSIARRSRRTPPGACSADELVHQEPEDQDEPVPQGLDRTAVTYKSRIYAIPEFTSPITIIGVNAVMRERGHVTDNRRPEPTRNWTNGPANAGAKKMYQSFGQQVLRGRRLVNIQKYGFEQPRLVRGTSQAMQDAVNGCLAKDAAGRR